MKKCYTRKQRALRRLALAVLLLAALNLLGVVNSLPAQAARDAAAEVNLTKPQVIYRYHSDALPIYRFAVQELIEGENGIVLCSLEFHPLLGWGVWDRCAAAIRRGETMALGWRYHGQGEAESARLFGRVDDERIARIVLRWRPGTGIEDDFRYWEMPEEAFFRLDGRRYVLCDALAVGSAEINANGADHRFLSELTALGYDAAGTLLAETTVDSIWWYTPE